ncbi:MAG: hypothetical protein JNL74_13835 [Fibrobacteres bacterium]|nr:hypothetical protein [Fibrobacterota bacterium]
MSLHTVYKRTVIPASLRDDLLKSAGCLPYSREVEIGGYITKGAVYYTNGSFDNVPVPAGKKIVFHTHPPKDRGDMPSELDILNMIFSKWDTSILLTEHKLIVIERTAEFDAIVESIEKRHDKHAIDAATILKTKGADALFYYLARTILKKHLHGNGVSHRTWPKQWESLLVNNLGLKLKTWDCVPYSCAA